jgi:hypothetical protein
MVFSWIRTKEESMAFDFDPSNFVVMVPYGGIQVPIRIQCAEGRLAVLAEPDKDSPGEKEALRVVELLHAHFENKGVRHESTQRNCSDGDRIDRLVIETLRS